MDPDGAPFLARWEQEEAADVEGSTMITEVRSETSDEASHPFGDGSVTFASVGRTQLTKTVGETADYVDVVGRTFETRAPKETTDESTPVDAEGVDAAGVLAPFLGRWMQSAPGQPIAGTVLTAERETTDDDRG
jgi:hypothetical protein